MTITELKSKYSSAQLSNFPGDNQLRYEMFAPLLNNLFDNKVIYRERFIGIIRLEEIRITPESFLAKAVPHLLIERESRFDKYFFNRTWEFGAIWSAVTLTGNALNAPYANWSIWCEPETVKKTEELALNKNFNEAIEFIQGI